MLLRGSCHCDNVTFEVWSETPEPYNCCYWCVRLSPRYSTAAAFLRRLTGPEPLRQVSNSWSSSNLCTKTAGCGGHAVNIAAVRSTLKVRQFFALRAQTDPSSFVRLLKVRNTLKHMLLNLQKLNTAKVRTNASFICALSFFPSTQFEIFFALHCGCLVSQQARVDAVYFLLPRPTSGCFSLVEESLRLMLGIFSARWQCRKEERKCPPLLLELR